MKEYTLIYFNEEGGCNITFETKKEINMLLKEINEEENGINSIITDLETIDSMYVDENKKYMIIKGLPVIPKVIEKIIKVEI